MHSPTTSAHHAITVVEQLPRNENGKVVRADVRALIEQRGAEAAQQ